MADLAEQLGTALGAAYRLEQELGGGGMSRVFLAEEIGLSRKVVVKVLPPEMAAGVNEDRFRREIQLAARLQHPHIVPLLTAGSSGDLLYYVMPFIKGESLRTKLSREGELPVGEAARILREVTDALAYAHAEGVVHRDIKPDNVMISGGHALVTDFGVAKAVSEGSTNHSLTSMGLAIGTPAYMSPEQASGDPHVDHRADLYALGAMAFEMLTGRPPFVGGSAQALLAAHVTQAPEHVSQIRPAVPAMLDALVMRCLEKRAADRWQQATELLPHLDALLTPSTGGTMPTSAFLVSDATRAAVRRADPRRVAGLFALASAGLLVLTWLLVRFIGLPTWVFLGAIALLAVGLPIMLLTARLEHQRAVARTTNARLAGPSGVQTLLTWQRAIAGGALAFAGLGVLTAVYMGMRLLGIGSVGTLMAKGALGDRDRIVLAELENRTSDSTLGATVTELLRTDLAQSRSVSVYDPAQLAEVTRQMQLPREAPITFDVAREVATRQGLKAVLAGDITSLGSGYIVSARLVGTASGDLLWTGRESAATANELSAAIDRLSANLRERVGESLRSIRADPPLEQMTTRSTEALRLFAQAERANDAGDARQGVALLLKAIALDSTFAMAHRKLGVMLRNDGEDTSKVNDAIRRAWAQRERLSVRERFLVDAVYNNYVLRDTAGAVAAYRSLLDRYPDDRAAANNLALLYNAMGKRPEALELYRNAVRQRTAAAVTFVNGIGLEMQLGHRDSALRMIEAFAAAYPDNPRTLTIRAEYMMSMGQLDSARAILDRRREATRGNARAQLDALNPLLRLALARGRLDEAYALFGEAMRAELQAFPQNAIKKYTTEQIVQARMLDFRSDVFRDLVGDTAAAATLLDQAAARIPPDDRPRVLNVYLDQVANYTGVKRPQQALAYWRKWEALVDDSVRRNLPASALGHRARIDAAEGRLAEAIAGWHIAAEKAACTTCFLTEFADAFERLGQTDSAITYMVRAQSDSGLGRIPEATFAETLGRLYEKRGDKAKAVLAYQQMIDLWKEADPILQPRLKAARDKVAALRTVAK